MYNAKMIAIDHDNQVREVESKGETPTLAHENLMSEGCKHQLGNPAQYRALIIVIVEGDGDFTVTTETKERDVYQN